MLRNAISNDWFDNTILNCIELVARCIEVLAVIVILLSIVYSLSRYLIRAVRHAESEDQYQLLRTGLGRALLLGLEILVAATVVRTVALDATIGSVVVLGMLVLVRTALSWSLVVEIEGGWPWQLKRE